MDLSRHFPFDGEVVWLTADQGGRRTGPPPTTVFAATGFVPPAIVDSGLASFAIRGFSHDLLRSPAEGVWLLAENLGAQRVQPGSVVVITEGSRPVAYFHVQRLTGEVKPLRAAAGASRHFARCDDRGIADSSLDQEERR